MNNENITVSNEIYHLTHNDGDAVGCALAIDYATHHWFKLKNNKPMHVIHKFTSTVNADKELNMYLDNIEKESNERKIVIPKYLFITDVSIKKETLTRLNSLIDELTIIPTYIDHHSTNKLDGVYDWVLVKERDAFNIKISAAYILFDYFYITKYTSPKIKSQLGKNKSSYIHDIVRLHFANDIFSLIDRNKYVSETSYPVYIPFQEYIDNISRYDTWLWKDDPREEMVEEYTTLLINQINNVEEAYKVINYEFFIRDDIRPNLRENPNLNPLISSAITKRKFVVDKYYNNAVMINQSEESYFPDQYGKANIAMVFLPDEFYNDILEKVYKDGINGDSVDIVCGLFPNTKSISFRRGNDKYDLGKLAQFYGGGGHVDASGAKLSTTDFLNMLELYYTTLDLKN